MARDWHAWHAGYDDPGSSLSRRLAVVRRQVALLLADGPARVASVCAGDGRDLLPELAALAAAGRTVPHAVLVELDPGLVAAARARAAALGLDDVEVLAADAGLSDAYRTVAPVQVLLLCGVLGNVSDDDAARTVEALPTLLAPGGQVVWTRGHSGPHDTGRPDAADRVRALFERAGFEEVDLVRPADAAYRVGVHRLVAPARRFEPGLRLFDFV